MSVNFFEISFTTQKLTNKTVNNYYSTIFLPIFVKYLSVVTKCFAIPLKGHKLMCLKDLNYQLRNIKLIY